MHKDSGRPQFGPEPGKRTEIKEIEESDTYFWLTTYAPNDKDKKNPIKISLDVRVFPEDLAKRAVAGTGRKEPN